MTDGHELLFIVGASRGGTTWIRELLAHHPEIAASASETDLFVNYVGPMWKRWNQPGANRLESVVGEQAFVSLCRNFVLGVFDEIAATKPGARVLAEKTPAHVHSTPLILRLFPRAKFLHVIRDPRAVVASMRAASSWTNAWPTGAASGAEVWRYDVTAGLEIAKLTAAYREVRYERVHSDGVRELAVLLSCLGVANDDATCQAMLDACRIEKLRKGQGVQGFYRRGESESWREELSPADIQWVEDVAGDLMDRLGYERQFPARQSALSPRVALLRAKSAARDAVRNWSPGTGARLWHLIGRL